MSNLLDKSSILLTPTAYENGKILSVKPNTSVGDFDFTRNSSATRVNSQGLIEDMQILSGDLVSNGDFSVDGIVNSSSYTLGWYSVDSGISISAGKLIITNGGSVGGRAYGTNGVNSISFITSGKSYKLVYTIEENNDNALVSYHNGGSYVTAPNTVGTHTIYYQAGGAIFILRNNSANTTIKIDNVSLIEITSDTNLPRIDYTGGVGHWLFEPQSTNLVTYSNSGVYGSSPASEILTTAPDGTNTAVRPVPNTGSNRYTGQISGGTYATNTKITYSWYRKRISTPVIDTYVGDLHPNILVNVTQVGSTIQIKSNINGFDRFSATFNITDGSLASNIRLYFGAIIGDGNSSVAYWGHQLEVGSFATSIIPTNGSQVTRLQDAANGAGSSDLINSTEGVLYGEIAALADDLTNRFISLTDGTDSNSVTIFYGGVSNRIRTEIKSGAVTQSNLLTTSYPITNYNKIAISYAENNFALWVNGVEVATDTSGSTPIGLNDLSFDRANILTFIGKAKCVAVFKEALTDAELTCLTTI